MYYAYERNYIKLDAQTLWTKEASLKLVEVVRANYDTLCDKLTKVKNVWTTITQGVQAFYPSVTGQRCDQKWRNLKKQYKKYVDNQGKTGRGRIVKPDFFDEIN